MNTQMGKEYVRLGRKKPYFSFPTGSGIGRWQMVNCFGTSPVTPMYLEISWDENILHLSADQTGF